MEDPAQLDQAMHACVSSTGPFLLDVAVEQQQNCFPMIPAGRGHHEIMWSEQRWHDPKGDVTPHEWPPQEREVDQAPGA